MTPVPANVTTYQCAIFEFPDLTDDVHMIATTPVIDNRQVMHHIVLFGCKGGQSYTRASGFVRSLDLLNTELSLERY